MDSKTISSGILLVVGVVILSTLVSALTVLFYGSTKQKPTTVIIQRPWWQNYKGWWGYHGAGLPGWGGPRYPPRPHPKPSPAVSVSVGQPPV